MNTMNLPDNQQYGSSARDDVDVINEGLIDIDSIQTDVDLFLKELHEEWKALIPFTCYVIHEKDEPCTFPIWNTLSRIDICNYLGGQMYPAARFAFCPNHTSHHLPMMKWIVRMLNHAMDGLLCGEICLSQHMTQGIQLSPMVHNNQLVEKQTIVCLDVEHFITALEHLLWNWLILLNIDVRLW
jgi:hypothetical protein